MSVFSQKAPSNFARFFLERESALNQPIGNVRLVEGPDGLISNIDFSEDLIIWDDHYITSNFSGNGSWAGEFSDTLLRLTSNHVIKPSVVEIGCGQGEVIRALQEQGTTCAGYDPA